MQYYAYENYYCRVGRDGTGALHPRGGRARDFKFRFAKFNSMKITMKIAMKISPRMILNVELPRRMILNFQNWKTTCTDYCSKYSCIDLQVV